MGQAQLPPQEAAKSTFARNLGRVSVGLAISLMASILGAFWYGRYFLNERLSPLLEVELNKAIKRPLQLGKVERIGMSSIRFGKSLVPPTDKESNFLAVEAIEVKVDPWTYLTHRQIGLDAVVEQPQVFLKQDVTGFLQLPKITPPERPTQEGLIDLRKITFNDAQITIQSISKGELVSLSQVQIDSNWKITDINNQSLKMKGKGFVTLPNIAAIAVPPNPEQLKKAIKTLNADKDSSKGSLDFDIDWDLTRGQGTIDLQSPNLQIAAVQGFAVSLPFEIQEGLLDFEAKVAILAGKEAPNISVTAQLTEGSIKSPKLPKPITQIAGKLNYDGTTASLKEFVAEYDFLKATVEGTFDQQKGFNVNFASTSLDLAKAIESFKVKVPVMIAGEIKLSGKLTGTSQKPALTMEISTPKPVSFDRIKVDRFLTTVELKDLNTLLIKKFQAASTGATLTGIGQIKLPQKDKPAEILFNSSLVGVAEEFINLYDTKLPVTIGQVTSSLQITGNLNNPQVLAQIEAPNATYPARGEVFIEDGLATIRNTKVSFPIGEVGLAGTYNIASGAWKTQLNSNGIPLAAFLPNQKGILQGLLNLRSDRGSFVLTDIIGDASIQLPQGLTELPDAITANLIWDGKNLLIPSLQVSNYLTANGNVDLAFPNNSPNQLPTGIAGINLDMISRNVSISRLASLSSVIPPQASGMLNFRGNLSGAIDKLKISGALQLEDVNLASLGSGLAKQGLVAPSRGSLNFNGSINGYFPDPRLVGNLRIAGLKVNQIELDNLNFQGVLDGISKVPQATGDLLLAGLRVDKLAFDPRLEGKVNFNANQGANIDLRGNRDRIVANLDQSFRPIDFNVNLGEATARGRRLDNNPNRLQVVVNNLPLPLVASFTGQNDLSGKVSSNLIADFSNNPKANGEVIIERPRFGRFIAERAIAKVTYADGVFSLRDGNLTVRQGESTNEYKFNLTYSPALDDSLAGAVEIAQGRMQDVFATLQWANIVDTTQVFSLTKTRAANLQPLEAIRLLGEPLYKQLQYLSQIELRQEQQETVNSTRNFNLPPLTEFRGDIKGKVTFGFNKHRGIRLGFDLVGKKFEYGKFAIDDVKVVGLYSNGVFAIANANFQSDKSYGKITKARLRLAPASNPLLRVREQSGEIELRDFPIESLRPLPFFSAIPIDLTGKINGNLSITGTSLLDTKVVGKLSLTDGTVNRQPIEFIAVQFNYDKLNVNFSVNMKVFGKEAVVATGNVGVFGNFNVKLDVKNEGIAFINIFNQPVRWVDGKGSIDLTASGTFRDPKIAGKITVDNAKVKVAGLPGDFSEVRGDIAFTSDRLISNITSNFSEGKLTMKGILPISNPNLLKPDTPEYQQALAINADQLKLNIRDISSNNFNSRVIVLGSLLTPEITGEVLLGDGRFVIGNDADPNSTAATNSNSDVPDVAFERLVVKLQNMQVTRFPIFNFLGEGTLIVNGTLQKPAPEGRVSITRGQFNAISARFRLDRSYENFVEFKATQGLNPILNVRVSGAVSEVTRVPINSNRPNDLFSPNEVPVSNLGSQRTLQVQASVTGTALVPDIRLSSSPPRSQSEIIALIGGGVLQNQGASDPASALANFAGSTVLNFLQDAIGDALNLAEFNLSPVTTNTTGSSRTGTLGLSAEAAVNVSNSFSIALQRIINDSTQPTNFSIRYRVDPNILMRGNYGSDGNRGISIEYENRF
ncbi:MAG: translocation/assembly module TamB domain-containing protein [Pseudanabaena sp.]|nr:translocation/assembly module TamB domain-containing protein [Pseudanabaena sp. M53BS1SP1A06MG]MCA6584496.1 translocation/assembly module TamB domain-containing protein [Pseudanabaena sp. M34BS1SP1A06MG]MCA6586958.1 translocation/assembly module TamB domain-containing protein [Pseudanabaena sp. M051S1SP1A06QC]MCA6588496.1 translocation/assembly module TamB domain-containing protein [Pseudanabaena sp. M109S1SP1A06QC]MCA6591338.1 translocation/assembly module TamB domain-containing protein [Ps